MFRSRCSGKRWHFCILILIMAAMHNDDEDAMQDILQADDVAHGVDVSEAADQLLQDHVLEAPGIFHSSNAVFFSVQTIFSEGNTTSGSCNFRKKSTKIGRFSFRNSSTSGRFSFQKLQLPECFLPLVH